MGILLLSQDCNGLVLYSISCTVSSYWIVIRWITTYFDIHSWFLFSSYMYRFRRWFLFPSNRFIFKICLWDRLTLTPIVTIIHSWMLGRLENWNHSKLHGCQNLSRTIKIVIFWIIFSISRLSSFISCSISYLHMHLKLSGRRII